MSCERYQIELTKQAQKDIAKLTPKLKNKLKDILRHKIAVHPFAGNTPGGSFNGLLFGTSKFSRPYCLS